MKRLRRLWRVAILPALCVAAMAEDAFPPGAISFFNTEACPSGWSVYGPAEGRAMLPLPASGLPGAQVGEALLSGEPAQHVHSVTGAFRTRGTRILTRPDSFDVRQAQAAGHGSGAPMGLSDIDSPGMPTLRLLVCRKGVGPAVGDPPRGIVGWFEQTECPNGWEKRDELAGRLLIAAPPDGEPGASLGRVSPLADRENPVHTHRISGSVNLPETIVFAGGFNCPSSASNCEGPYARSGSNGYFGSLEETTSGLPYIQLAACAAEGPPAPRVTAVTHAADFRPRPLAPGQLGSIFGERLGPAEAVGAELDDQGRVATERAGVRVRFDELEAPLFFVSERQINLQVPYELAGRTSGLLQVIKDGIASEPVEYRLAESAPGLFTLSGSDQAIAVYADGGLNSGDRPAREGDALVLFATGGGPLAPGAETGSPATPPLGAIVLPFGVTIGGQPAVVDYFGAAPGFVGLLQLNTRMNAVRGNPRIVLTVGGASSDPAAFLVAEP